MMSRRVDPLSIPCPVCGAAAGVDCVTRLFTAAELAEGRRGHHVARAEAAERARKQAPIVAWPDLDVRCSCGATTTIRQDKAGVYQPDDPAWSFHVADDDVVRSRLWNCGGAGHRQAGVAVAIEDQPQLGERS